MISKSMFNLHGDNKQEMMVRRQEGREVRVEDEWVKENKGLRWREIKRVRPK